MPGVFALMLHSHIPYCRKSGVWPAGEEWLFEAMNETYIPLLRMLRTLHLDGISPRIMIGLVPILMEQLSDGYMKDRFCAYMEDKIKRARNDILRFQADTARSAVARYWLEIFESNYEAYTADFYRDILGTLKWLQDEGAIEVLTSAATHGFLPLLESDGMVYAQVHNGVETYKSYFGRDPRGFWLPECAYRPAEWSHRDRYMRKAIDEWLAGEGIEYFFVEDVGITRSAFAGNQDRDKHPTAYQGYRLASGVSVFGRNDATGKQVWSPDRGYPGDPFYLEFHSKDSESGLHYSRVTGRPDKEVYDPVTASERVKIHARHFTALVADLLHQAAMTSQAPVIVAPYDCELFGHWWHEGVNWLEQVYRLLAEEAVVSCRTLGEYLDENRQGFPTISMQPSTWGLNSDFTVWLNPEHGWIWPYINSSSREAEQVLDNIRPEDERGQRILRQMARELLLMQGSDWPFLLFTTQAKEYANQRFHHHHQRFLKLLWAAKDLGDKSRLSEEALRQMEDVDCPWPAIDWAIFRHRKN
ncbi:MAG TPA: 1,4-alpha-glucan branching protein domain-containing protein [Desulfomonilia bacterium]|nr:1,4-alpha-glucan branching protein domain-containing protein [Desulfomonilia bacterium]